MIFILDSGLFVVFFFVLFGGGGYFVFIVCRQSVKDKNWYMTADRVCINGNTDATVISSAPRSGAPLPIYIPPGSSSSDLRSFFLGRN